jgi:superfamily II DNA/RNA helicase
MVRHTHIYSNFVQISVSVQVIIATPGRILDLMDKNVAIMDSCRMLVLDEVKCLDIMFRYFLFFSLCVVSN